MAPWVESPVLDGSLVRLEPLAVRHAADLAVAAEEDRGSYGFTLVPRASEVGDYLNAQFARAANGLIARLARRSHSPAAPGAQTRT